MKVSQDGEKGKFSSTEAVLILVERLCLKQTMCSFTLFFKHLSVPECMSILFALLFTSFLALSLPFPLLFSSFVV